ncbi:hypothetical protein [Burkholderia vietnamiensis]|uniref:hypothetical protein n=1 Tax=Burkholderia vietnamiensis TaxID=60552 RepID=UPI001594350B|nr:hypothetical protein [Burkholderia vietnamiensis]
MPISNVWIEPRAEGRPYSPIFPHGACCSMWQKPAKNHEVSVYETHHGLCLYEREYNGYDDSDFYMTYWDESQGKPIEVMVATTRGWSPMGSRVDATPEVQAKYQAWQLEQERRQRMAERANRARHLRATRAADRELAQLAGGVPVLRIRSLRRAYGEKVFSSIERLLRTRKFRSSFRANIATQIRDWLADPAPRWPTPLSSRQIEYI